MEKGRGDHLDRGCRWVVRMGLDGMAGSCPRRWTEVSDWPRRPSAPEIWLDARQIFRFGPLAATRTTLAPSSTTSQQNMAASDGDNRGEGPSQPTASRHAFISFPGAPYTHSSVLRAAHSTLAPAGWTLHERDQGGHTDEDTVQWIEEKAGAEGLSSTSTSSEGRTLYLMDYDLIPFDSIHPSRASSSSASPSASSYPIRKALIRKNWLYSSIQSHSVKSSSSASASASGAADGEGGKRSALSYLPRTWSVDIQFADDLDELLIDELYDLKEILDKAEQEGEEKKWFILKAGMADRGMGIKMFDSLEALQEILEEWEGDDDSDDDDSDGEAGKGEEEDSDEGDNGVLLGQLRHFVIQVRRRRGALSRLPISDTNKLPLILLSCLLPTQEYISHPLLIAPTPSPTLSYRKFHLRAYVLCIGGLQVYLWDEMLALFAPAAYQDPSSDPDPKIHLTNTCLHADGSATADGRAAEENVHLLSDLCREGAGYASSARGSADSGSGSGSPGGKLTTEDLARLRALARETVGATFEGAAKGSGSTNWLMWEGCWEVFGVDLMVGWVGEEWRMWLLEVNAVSARARPRGQGEGSAK